jgi:hypothetical protein
MGNRPCLRLRFPVAITVLAVTLDIRMIGLSWCFLRCTVLYDLHPGFSTTIAPVGSIVAVRFVFHLCLLLPLVNNHIRLLSMLHATCDLLRSIQLRLV